MTLDGNKEGDVFLRVVNYDLSDHKSVDVLGVARAIFGSRVSEVVEVPYDLNWDTATISNPRWPNQPKIFDTSKDEASGYYFAPADFRAFRVVV